MSMRINQLILILSIILTVGCKEKKAEQFQALPFPDVMPPEMLETPQDRAEYMAEHWWDKFADDSRAYPCDSTLVSGVSREVVEQKFANWVNVLSMVDYPHAAKSVRRLYDKALKCERKDTASNVFDTFRTLVEKYLYDPNSPMRNEDLYGP